MPAPESPPEDVIIRPSTAPAPTFSGMTPTLPSALRELRQHINSLDNENNYRTPRPSEMTALARRFGGIRIDHSPNSERSTPSKAGLAANKTIPIEQPPVKPVKLDFDYDDVASSKENIIVGERMQFTNADAESGEDHIDVDVVMPPPEEKSTAPNASFDNMNQASPSTNLQQLSPPQQIAPSSAHDETERDAMESETDTDAKHGTQSTSSPDKNQDNVLTGSSTHEDERPKHPIIDHSDNGDEKHDDESVFTKIAVTSPVFEEKVDSPGIKLDDTMDKDTKGTPDVQPAAPQSSNDQSIDDEGKKNADQSRRDENVDPIQLTSPRVQDAAFDAEPITPVESVRSIGNRLHRSSVRLPVTRPDVASSVDRIRSIRMSRMSWRTKLETPLLLGKKAKDSGNFTNGGLTPNADGRSSARDGSQSTRASSVHGRLYTDKEVTEIRQEAIDTVIENLGWTHKEERDRLTQERQQRDRFLEKERAENHDLKNVLEEYEQTMNKMVADANTQASTRERLLQTEKNILKAEVVELRDAFEQLKVRYDKTKQTMDVMGTKETRLIEQISNLRKNMVQLQSWSDEVKANTEKKLNKAFDSVTSFRTSFLEQEAHAKKALSDLAKERAERRKESENLAVTAKKVAQLEIELRNEQDSRSELKGELMVMKGNLTRITAERDIVAAKLDGAQKEVGVLRDKVNELEPRASRANEFKKQMDIMRSERQGLKARAFDDITRIRELEDSLKAKDNELEELSLICEEAMSQLEAQKVNEAVS